MSNIPPVPLGPIVNPATGIMNQAFSQWLVQSIRPAVATAINGVTLSGDVTGSGGATIVTTISAGAVTLPKMASIPSLTFIGNDGGATATPQALSPARAVAILPAGGDLAGNYAAPTVRGLQGSPLPTPVAGLLQWTGTAWFLGPPPAATSSVLGGVRPDGTSILNAGGAISATAASVGAVPLVGSVTASVAVTWTSGQIITITEPAISMDASGSTLSLANGAYADFTGISGLLQITETLLYGATALLLCGGNATVVVAQSTGTNFVASSSSGNIRFFYNAGTSAYRLQNNSGSALQFGVYAISTRDHI